MIFRIKYGCIFKIYMILFPHFQLTILMGPGNELILAQTILLECI
jgi:hypothetical protein